MKSGPLLAIFTFILAGAAHAAEIDSVSRLTFGPDNILFLADWKQAKVHALTLPAAGSGSDQPFNFVDFGAKLNQAVGTTQVTIEDMGARPGTGEVYVAVSYGKQKLPAVFAATPDGQLRRLDFKTARSSSAPLEKAPDSGTEFWKSIPERSFTATDMKWHAGKLYVAGLSNQDFASTLRVIDYPFDGRAAMTSVEIFHTAHNQVETRAPIRAMNFFDLNGKTYLVAAYTCTPLVTIALDELKDGAHLRGKTVAELGYGNTPNNMVSFSAKGQDGKAVSYLLLTNVNRNADTIPVASLATANEKPGLLKAVDWGVITGVEAQPSPISSVLRIDNYNEQLFVALRRDLATGDAQLVTMGKAYKLRLSDYISEYDFPSYTFSTDFQKKYIKPVQDEMMRQEGYADLVAKEKLK